jgi:HEAT repeat protein
VRREFRESATLALGRLGRGDDATRAFLADVLRSGPRDESFVRAFAAVALGLAGDDPSHASAEALLETVARAEPDGNVKPACLLALGLLGSDSAAPRLADAAVSGRPPRESTDGLSAVERAYAVEALARVAGREDATRELLSKLVREHGVPVEVRRAAVCAIGRSTSPGDDRTRAEVRLLLDVVDDAAADEDVRRLALVALGRRGASAGGAEEAAEIAAAVLRLFGRLEDDAAPFAASALGMIVRAPTTHERVVTKIRRRMESDARDAVRGAFEAVLVVRRDEVDDGGPAIDGLVAVLRDPSASGDRLRAAASALGEIGDRDDVPALARAAADADYRPRVPAVEALASVR